MIWRYLADWINIYSITPRCIKACRDLSCWCHLEAILKNQKQCWHSDWYWLYLYPNMSTNINKHMHRSHQGKLKSAGLSSFQFASVRCTNFYDKLSAYVWWHVHTQEILACFAKLTSWYQPVLFQTSMQLQDTFSLCSGGKNHFVSSRLQFWLPQGFSEIVNSVFGARISWNKLPRFGVSEAMCHVWNQIRFLWNNLWSWLNGGCLDVQGQADRQSDKRKLCVACPGPRTGLSSKMTLFETMLFLMLPLSSEFYNGPWRGMNSVDYSLWNWRPFVAVYTIQRFV